MAAVGGVVTGAVVGAEVGVEVTIPSRSPFSAPYFSLAPRHLHKNLRHHPLHVSRRVVAVVRSTLVVMHRPLCLLALQLFQDPIRNVSIRLIKHRPHQASCELRDSNLAMLVTAFASLLGEVRV